MTFNRFFLIYLVFLINYVIFLDATKASGPKEYQELLQKFIRAAENFYKQLQNSRLKTTQNSRSGKWHQIQSENDLEDRSASAQQKASKDVLGSIGTAFITTGKGTYSAKDIFSRPNSDSKGRTHDKSEAGEERDPPGQSVNDVDNENSKLQLMQALYDQRDSNSDNDDDTNSETNAYRSNEQNYNRYTDPLLSSFRQVKMIHGAILRAMQEEAQKRLLKTKRSHAGVAPDSVSRFDPESKIPNERKLSDGLQEAKTLNAKKTRAEPDIEPKDGADSLMMVEKKTIHESDKDIEISRSKSGIDANELPAGKSKPMTGFVVPSFRPSEFNELLKIINEIKFKQNLHQKPSNESSSPKVTEEYDENYDKTNIIGRMGNYFGSRGVLSRSFYWFIGAIFMILIIAIIYFSCKQSSEEGERQALLFYGPPQANQWETGHFKPNIPRATQRVAWEVPQAQSVLTGATQTPKSVITELPPTPKSVVTELHKTPKYVTTEMPNTSKSVMAGYALHPILRDVICQTEIIDTPPPRGEQQQQDLIDHVVATGEDRKIDNMLSTEDWHRSYYTAQGRLQHDEKEHVRFIQKLEGSMDDTTSAEEQRPPENNGVKRTASTFSSYGDIIKVAETTRKVPMGKCTGRIRGLFK